MYYCHFLAEIVLGSRKLSIPDSTKLYIFDAENMIFSIMSSRSKSFVECCHTLGWRTITKGFLLRITYSQPKSYDVEKIYMKWISNKEIPSYKDICLPSRWIYNKRSTIPGWRHRKVVGCKEMFLCAFIDMVGVFGNTSHTFIARPPKAQNLDASLIWYTQSMSINKLIGASLEGNIMKASTEMCCS